MLPAINRTVPCKGCHIRGKVIRGKERWLEVWNWNVGNSMYRNCTFVTPKNWGSTHRVSPPLSFLKFNPQSHFSFTASFSTILYPLYICPLIWMFHSRGLNNKIYRFHERALRITFNDKSSTFQELLDKNNSANNCYDTP